MLNSILVILCLIAVSAFFSISEISLAASRKIKLKLLADEGNINATRILKMQENPGCSSPWCKLASTRSPFSAVSWVMLRFPGVL
jgi:CBS domain containing-hemolysin-like protein